MDFLTAKAVFLFYTENNNSAYVGNGHSLSGSKVSKTSQAVRSSCMAVSTVSR